MEATMEGRSSSRESTGMCLIASATTLTAISRTADLHIPPLGSVGAEEGARVGAGAVTSAGESSSAKKKKRKR